MAANNKNNSGKGDSKLTEEEDAFEESHVYYAYRSIHNFFDVFGLAPALKLMDSILQAAAAPRVWKKKTPATLLFYIENIQAVFKAAFTIYYSHTQRKKALLAAPAGGVPDMDATGNFIDSWHGSTGWNNFPRHLTARQYHNPYRAIKKFCTYMAEPQWTNFLKDITEYALCKKELIDTFPPYRLLPARQHVLQLIETCHLIEVRTASNTVLPPAPFKKKKPKSS